MKHLCWWDAAHRCVRLEIVDEITPDEAERLMDQMLVFDQANDSRGMIVDHRRSPRAISRETRQMLEDKGKRDLVRSKVAIIGMTSVNRLLAQIVVAVLGHSKFTRFFATEEEAVAWMCAD